MGVEDLDWNGGFSNINVSFRTGEQRLTGEVEETVGQDLKDGAGPTDTGERILY